MYLSELKTGESAVIVKVHGHGGFRKRLIEMGFIAGKKVRVVQNAPLKDPIEYEILGYRISLRRAEAGQIEVLGESEARTHIRQEHASEILYADDCGELAILNREMAELAEKRQHVIRVALVGNPNCGKTSLFNIASGSNEHVGNYSGVTVDAKEGRFSWGGYDFVFVDLPGTYSLSAYSPEELYVRKNLIEELPDVIINVVDASNIERNLYLTTQVIDMNLRVVMALNMYDELEAKGDTLDMKQLSRLLGIPVCPTVSRDGRGIGELLDTVIKVYTRSDPSLSRHIHINHGKVLERSIDAVKARIAENEQIRHKYSTRYLAIKYLESDSDVERIISALPNAAEIAAVRSAEEKRIMEELGTNAESAIVDAKYAFIQGALAETLSRHIDEHPRRTLTDRIDAIVTNRWLAFPIFILILFMVFEATFAIGQYPMDWIDALVAWFGDTVGSLMRDGWLRDLVVDGIIAGVGSVLVFLPNILILYFFISIMEDSGYMSRAAFIVDSLMHRIGLHGKSFIPMVMGFGCNVPAIMATRAIESRKSRLMTIAVIPFMSCSGRLPVFVLLAGAFFPHNAALALMCIYLLGIVLAIVSAKMLSKFVRDDDLPFVMELPPYRMPTGKAIWRHTWEKGRQYLEKMATTILVGSIIVWTLGYFPHDMSKGAAYQQEHSYIGMIGKAVSPALEPLGFSWKMDIGLISGVVAKELVVSTMGVMYAGDGADGPQAQAVIGADTAQEARLSGAQSSDMALQGALQRNVSLPAAVAFMIFILLYFPCIATFVAIKHETGGWKWPVAVCAYTMAVAWVIAWLGFRVTSLFV
ncbi:MAG: ferrous iron transport protein B [Candidatus Cryptobacteroides sp.]